MIRETKHYGNPDFDNIKQNLKTYLNKQKEFTDYDFEGSGMDLYC